MSTVLDEIEQALADDIRCWFPRVLAAEGYHERFARDWSPLPHDRRSLVYHARLAWTAAAFAAHAPEHRDAFAAYALHGIRFIDGPLRDHTHGGFFFDVATDGRPLRDGEKHVVAIAFTIFAAARTFAVSGDPRARAVARDGLEWLERHCHCGDDPGYVEELRRDGSPMGIPPPARRRGLLAILPPRRQRNPIGRPYGGQTANTHLHVLEAFAEL